MEDEEDEVASAIHYRGVHTSHFAKYVILDFQQVAVTVDRSQLGCSSQPYVKTITLHSQGRQVQPHRGRRGRIPAIFGQLGTEYLIPPAPKFVIDVFIIVNSVLTVHIIWRYGSRKNASKYTDLHLTIQNFAGAMPPNSHVGESNPTPSALRCYPSWQNSAARRRAFVDNLIGPQAAAAGGPTAEVQRGTTAAFWRQMVGQSQRPDRRPLSLWRGHWGAGGSLGFAHNRFWVPRNVLSHPLIPPLLTNVCTTCRGK